MIDFLAASFQALREIRPYIKVYFRVTRQWINNRAIRCLPFALVIRKLAEKRGPRLGRT